MNQLHQLLIHRPSLSQRPRVMASLARNPLKSTATDPHQTAHFMIGKDVVDVYYWGVKTDHQELVDYATKLVNWIKDEKNTRQGENS